MELFLNYPAFYNNLNRVENLILHKIKSEYHLLSNMLDNLVLAGGKRIRPACVLLAADFGENTNKEEIHNLAAAVEILHMATLIHDDIIDEATVRRGAETINKKFGSKVAVFSGDYLFCQAFDLFSSGQSNLVMGDVSRVVKKICEGEIEQFFNRFNFKLSVRDYLRRIRRKTALLFALSFFLGGRVAGLDQEMLNKLRKLGLFLGMGYQITDDLLDLYGNREKMGKDTGYDFSQGIYSLPFILRLEEERYQGPLALILKKRNKENEELVLRLIREGDYIDRTRKLAEKYFDRAKKIINELPPVEAREILTYLLNWIRRREF